MELREIDVEAAVRAAEADAGHPLPGLRESLEQARRGEFAAIHTPQEIAARRSRGRPKGSVAAVRKEAITLRLAPDVLERWRATGKGWQTRMAQVLCAQAPGA